MKYILDVLNKIKWDKRLKQKDFSIVYTDRILDSYKEIPFTSIKKIEGYFIALKGIDEDIYIPLHRIRGVNEKGKVIWNR